MLAENLKKAIRDIPDFPKPGILFKDITPLLQNPVLCKEITQEFIKNITPGSIDAVFGIESRGFLFGMMIAEALGTPFVPVRKAGKLPYTTIREEYTLEYGTATIEIHTDAIKPGAKVMIHDDLLATGGTAEATGRLVKKAGGVVACYSFLVSLDFLMGKEKLLPFSSNIISLINY
ncbi:MAG: adenine phosphoribosyltransferase [Bacteroidia bacterium]|nr:adenine phosphoribosyltransferase [Bacteroidia bacterium]MCZ2247729.1 adenine phosphoribosyltransferase [Bacteroidia bacterium]